MRFFLEYSVEATEDLADLTDHIRKQIVKKLGSYLQYDDPFVFAKPLVGTMRGLYRFRIGDYRAIFRKKADGTITIILILRVKNRKDVYE